MFESKVKNIESVSKHIHLIRTLAVLGGNSVLFENSYFPKARQPNPVNVRLLYRRKARENFFLQSLLSRSSYTNNEQLNERYIKKKKELISCNCVNYLTLYPSMESMHLSPILLHLY